METQQAYIVRAPIFPLYSHVRECIKAWADEKVSSVRAMIYEIYDKTGTPQDPVDWSNPDKWIPERLEGESARLARKLWVGSHNTVNPRFTYGCYLLINRLRLLDRSGEFYRLNSRSKLFLEENPELLRELDAGEGLPKILSLVAEKPQGKRSDFVGAWGDYLKAVSKFSTSSTFNDTLSRRLLNLVERKLVERDGNRYSITPEGLQYLKTFPVEKADKESPSERTDVALAVKAFNDAQMKALRERLMALKPYDFEHFVKELLEAMDYEKVEVTKQSGDKGIDVVANFQFGITEIREVVQVKRTEGTIGRRVIDELRGALPYHQAIRGTVITLGPFAKGVKEAALFPGAAPITLIDGRKLLELVVKHEVGVKRKPVDLLQIDEEFFTEREAPEEAVADEEAS